MTVYHACKKGSESTAIALNVTTDKYPSIDMMFVKFSGGRRAGFNVGMWLVSKEVIGSLAPLGTGPFGIDVVLSGTAMPLWNPHIYSNGGFHVTSGTKNNDTFYIWMDDPNMVQDFTVDIKSKVPVDLSGPAAHVIPLS